jgi:twitching motility two-component system response regulator PilG
MTPRDLSQRLLQEAHFGPIVLIADDSKTMRTITKHALEREGLQTVEATTPLEAIAAAGEYRPDIFLLDITFGAGTVTDGYQLCRTLRDLPEFRETPILLVSGHDGFIDRMRGRLAGATDFVAKPFDVGDLLARVRQLAFMEWWRRQERAQRS